MFARANSRVLEVNPVTLELVWSYNGPRFYSSNISGAQSSNAVYRGYRVPYSWIPQVTRPGERAVTPPPLQDFRGP